MEPENQPSPVSSMGDISVGQVVTIHHWLQKKVMNPGAGFSLLLGGNATGTIEEVADTSWVGEIFVVTGIQLPFVRVVPILPQYYKFLTWDLRRCVLMELKDEFLSDEELEVLKTIREKVGKKRDVK